jgi:predicted RecB family nuclease
VQRARPITGTHFFQRERCRRLVWLEFHGDPARKSPPDARLAALLARGREHEREVVAGLDVVQPKYACGDFEAGARATSELLRARTPLVYQGVLTAEGRVGLPDLLRYDAEAGRYVVGDVKASAEAKVEHAMQVAFYANLLAGNPEAGPTAPPARAFLLLAGGREEALDLTELAPLFDEAKRDVDGLRAGAESPRPFYGVHCQGCTWRNVCIPEMEAAKDLSLVHGVTPARRDALEACGVQGAESLTHADAADLAARCELPQETLRRLRLQARAILTGAPAALGKLPFRPARIAVTAALLRDPRGTHVRELLLHRTTRIQDRLEERWFQEEALTPADEARAYRRFLTALHEDKDAPVYHYGPAFPDALSSLDARHGRVGDPIRFVFERLVDVQAAVRCALVLPVYAYDLDSVARALGASAPPPPSAERADSDGETRLADRRRLAAEILTIREVRVAAQREWSRRQGTPAQREDGAPAPILTTAP